MRPRIMFMLAILLLLAGGAVWTYSPRATQSRQTPARPVAAAAMPDTLFAWRDVASIDEARQMLFDAYRLPPDSRILSALEDLAKLADPRNSQRADARWEAGHWVVLLGADEVGTLPEFPGFEDGMSMLDAWVAQRAAPAPAGSRSAPADAALGQGDPIAALAALDENEPVTRAHAAQAGRALIWIAVATPDVPTRDADALLARAWAAVAWAGPEASTEERALLAHRMRYARQAELLANELPEGSAVRALVEGDSATLARESSGAAAGSLPDLLHLLAISNASHEDEWWERLARSGRTDAARSLAFSTIVRLGRSFELSDTLMQGMLDQGLDEARRVGGVRSDHWAGIRRGTAADDLARRLAACEPRARGPWLARGLALAHARALTFGALHARFTHVAVSQGSLAATDDLLATLGSSEDPVAGELVEWMNNVREDTWGEPSSDRYRREMLDSPHLSARLLGSQYRERVSPSAMDGTRTLRALMQRLDSRPEHLNQLLHESDGMARVPAVRARVLSPLARAGGDFGAYATLVQPLEQDDEAAWRAALASPRVPVRSKLAALAVRELTLPHTRDLQGDYRAVLAQHPQVHQVTLSLSSYLERTGRFVQARKVLETWRGSGFTDQAIFDTLDVAVRTARLFRREGSAARSLRLLERFVIVGKLSVVAEYARALDALGLEQDAMECAGALRVRYPQWLNSTALAAELHWRHGRYDAAAIAIHSLGKRGPTEWDESIAPVFLEVFRRQPDAAVEVARALAAHLVEDSPMLIRLAMAFDAAGDPGTGFRICEQSIRPGVNVLLGVSAGYDMLARAQGESRAMAWFATQRFASADVRAMAIETIAADDHGALALAEPLPTHPGHREFALLVQAAAAMTLPADAPERRALAATLHAEAGGDYLTLARYLLEGGDPGPLLALARGPKRRTEVFHWVGRRMELESRWEDAAVCYQLSLETGASNNGEWGWSLRRLARVEKVMRRQRAPGAAAGRPIAAAL